MKKLFVFLFIAFFTVNVNGQSVDKLFSVFWNTPEADKVSIGSFGFSFVKLAFLGDSDAGMLKKINSVKVLDLSSCDNETKHKFADQVENLQDKNYELLMMTKDEEDEMLIFARKKAEKIKELIIIDKNDPLIVRIKGNFNLSEILEEKDFKRFAMVQ